MTKAVQLASWDTGVVTGNVTTLRHCASGPRTNFIGSVQNRTELKQSGSKILDRTVPMPILQAIGDGDESTV